MTYFTILKGEIQMQIRVKVYLDSSEYFKKLIFDIDESRCKWMWNISDKGHCNFEIQIVASEFNIWLQLYFENVFHKIFSGQNWWLIQVLLLSQSMTYTYGICGPLKLSVDKASNLNTVYMSCFMTGRFSAIFVSRYKFACCIIFLANS